MIRAANLSYKYPGATALRFPAIKVEAGAACLIGGQSGSGKTTLLHLLAGLLQPATGSVEIRGVEMQTLGKSASDKFRAVQIGVVFQQPHFIQSLTVLENLEIAAFLAKQWPAKRRGMELLDRLDLADHAQKPPASLSSGQQQRLSVARAMMNKPALILADEPTASLDDLNTTRVIYLLREISSEQNAALIVVSHDNRIGSQFSQKIKLG